MKISLNGFSDCGKCSFGTLLDDYDTDDNLIYLDHKEVKIEKVEDLFPFFVAACWYFYKRWKYHKIIFLARRNMVASFV